MMPQKLIVLNTIKYKAVCQTVDFQLLTIN